MQQSEGISFIMVGAAHLPGEEGMFSISSKRVYSTKSLRRSSSIKKVEKTEEGR